MKQPANKPPSGQAVLLFGDQTSDRIAGIRALVQNARVHPAASRFEREAWQVVRSELRDCKCSGTAGSLMELAEQDDANRGQSLVVSTVLMVVGRLGQLMVHAHNDPTILGSPARPVVVVAQCTGLLPAAAVLAASDTSQLFPLAAEILRVTFRLARAVEKRARIIASAPNKPWGRTYTGLTEKQANSVLARFHAQHADDISVMHRLTVGVVSAGWVSIMGPPSSLARLLEFEPLVHTPSIDMEIRGPIHGDWLPRVDINSVLGDSPLLDMPIDANKALMVSPATCVTYSAMQSCETLRDLLGQIVDDIVHGVLRVSESIRHAVQHVQREGDGELDIRILGPNVHLGVIKQELEAGGFRCTAIHDKSNARGLILLDEHLDDTKLISDSPYAFPPTQATCPIAIVGMAGRFPGSETIQGFWDDLMAAKCHLTPTVPASRFDVDAHFDPTGLAKNSTQARHGAWLDDPFVFDHTLFNMSLREAAQTDPSHRQLLMASYEALQSAGYYDYLGSSKDSKDDQFQGGGNKKKIGVYFGQLASEWQQILEQQGVDTYFVPGSSRAFAPARVAHHFGWNGGTYALDAACSTSLSAVALACQSLQSGEHDTALAGGVSLLLSPNTFAGLSQAGMVSTTGGCRALHADADGYARGEGVGVVMLKRLPDALTANDTVLGVIRSVVRAHGAEAPAMVVPSQVSQQAVMAEALRRAGVGPQDMAHVEMHATGTPVGDPQEVAAIVKTFAAITSMEKKKKKTRRAGPPAPQPPPPPPLTLGAVKASLGHAEAAAGVTALIKSTMVLRRRMVPPQPGWPFKLNPQFSNLETLNIKLVVGEPCPLRPRSDPGSVSESNTTLKVLVNNFDAAGGNVSLVLEEFLQHPRPQSLPGVDPRDHHIVTLSAKTRTALDCNRERLLRFLESHPDTLLADLAYTTTARRIHEEPHRRAYVASSVVHLMQLLREDCHTSLQQPKQQRSTKKRRRPLVFLFTGQGSHFAGMGSVLYLHCPVFRAAIQECQEAATARSLPSFLDVFVVVDGADDDKANPDCTVKTQLATLALEIALTVQLAEWGVAPDLVLGHSLGEYAALVAAGVLSIGDAVDVVGNRAASMQANLASGMHGMLATTLSEAQLDVTLQALQLSTTCFPACVNAPSWTVASGPLKHLAVLKEHLGTQGVNAKHLPVPFAYHSPYMDPIIDELSRAARRIPFATPMIPVMSSLTGQLQTVFTGDYVTRQTRGKVDFSGALQKCHAALTTDEDPIWLEVGPDAVCSAMLRKTLSHAVESVDVLAMLKPNTSAWATVTTALGRLYAAGVSVHWPAVHEPYVRAGALRMIDLPLYAFDRRLFWTPWSETAPADATKKKLEVDSGSHLNTVSISTRLLAPDMAEAIRGHVVNGQAICPMVVFQHLALQAAQTLYARSQHRQADQDTMPPFLIQDMALTQAIRLDSSTPESSAIRVTATWDTCTDECPIMPERGVPTRLALVVFFHDDAQSGSCKVRFSQRGRTVPTPETGPIKRRYKELATEDLARQRIKTLRRQATTGAAHWLLKPVVYRLFSSVVEYAQRYQALEEVVVASDLSEAVGIVKLRDEAPAEQSDVFHTSTEDSVYHADGVAHLVGVLANCGLRYPAGIACLFHGFDEWYRAGSLKAGETYTTYVRMVDGEGEQKDKDDVVEVGRGGDGGNTASLVTADCLVFDSAGVLVQKFISIKASKLTTAAFNAALGAIPEEGLAYKRHKTTGRGRRGQAKAATGAITSPANCSASRSSSCSTFSGTPASDGDSPSGSGLSVVDSVLAIVASECDAELEDLSDEIRLEDLGVDSLMALGILKRVQTEAGIFLPRMLFGECDSVGQFREAVHRAIS